MSRVCAVVGGGERKMQDSRKIRILDPGWERSSIAGRFWIQDPRSKIQDPDKIQTQNLKYAITMLFEKTSVSNADSQLDSWILKV